MGSSNIEQLRQWSVAGGVVRQDDGSVLLVHNVRRDGRKDWSTPGGVVDAGESYTEALSREVTEETGLVISGWTGPLYRVEVIAPELGFHLQVETHLAQGFSGEISIDDPDGIVIAASFVDLGQAESLLAGASLFVSEPLMAHLVDGVDDGRTFGYEIQGPSKASKVVRTQ